MKTISLLSVIFFTINFCSGQHAKIFYQDTVINVRIKEYSYDGLLSTAGFMKWRDIRKVEFSTKRNIRADELKVLQQYAIVVFADESILNEEKLKSEVMSFDNYYKNHILVFKDNSASAKSTMLLGLAISAVGAALINNKDLKNAPEILGITGGSLFIIGLGLDLHSLKYLDKESKN